MATGFDEALKKAIQDFTTTVGTVNNGNFPLAFRYLNLSTEYNIRFQKAIDSGLEVWQAEWVAASGTVVTSVSNALLDAALFEISAYIAAASPPSGAMIFSQGIFINAQAAGLGGDGTAWIVEQIVTSSFWQEEVVSTKGWVAVGAGQSGVVKLISGNDAAVTDTAEITFTPTTEGFVCDITSSTSFDVEEFLLSLSQQYETAFYTIPAEGVKLTATGSFETAAIYIGSDSENILSITNEVTMAFLGE